MATTSKAVVGPADQPGHGDSLHRLGSNAKAAGYAPIICNKLRGQYSLSNGTVTDELGRVMLPQRFEFAAGAKGGKFKVGIFSVVSVHML